MKGASVKFTPLLNRKDDIPLYHQLYEYIKKEIVSSRVEVNDKLPSIRSLAAYLNVSRNTVDMAYQQLLAEGYVESKPKSGLYVTNTRFDLLQTDRKPTVFLHPHSETKSCTYDFRYGKVDSRLFPLNEWKKRYNESLQTYREALFTYQESQGEESLREEIATYLYQSRGVVCSKHQIVIGAGTQQSLSLLAQMLKQSIRDIAFENPCYDGASFVFKQHGFSLKTVSLNNKGINIQELYDSQTRAVYVTPSHQFPYGMIMPVSRRIELLEWANDCNGFIIEDDYDGEFRYKGSPIPSLQSLDSNGRVIYTGTFSKSFMPSLRISYLVLPEVLLKTYHEQRFSLYEQAVPTLHQQTLGLIMKNGEWNKHLRRVRTAYQLKHSTLLAALQKEFNENITISGELAGLHILVRVHNDMNEQQLINAARKQDVSVYGTSRYWLTEVPKQKPHILLGFGSLRREEIEEGIRRLKKAWL
ncbi:GntR family transcriptional regulator [Priestia megaterium]|nr:PLP-dependent aminotransferase family protein [Priestia megaterium]MCM3150594.1 PLP-dependent aminotransferase family protein [Priestia megaterium]MCU7740433.1 PLP-dependent aminotransferase family protein [Priestia megaterium]PEU72682.1 GntR family transcriptional regulator [Priestia megaterium]PFL00797.1 GntR family transcriptional regulator [Priestia megaterium]PFQ85281.1 GntR family transcriptional regulator [Priestia megaterium]